MALISTESIIYIINVNVIHYSQRFICVPDFFYFPRKSFVSSGYCLWNSKINFV